jgi:hypothetical protein
MIEKVLIDWCVNCALLHTDASKPKQLMFTWIVIQTLRKLPKSEYFFKKEKDHYIFVIKLRHLVENQSISSTVFSPTYWKFLKGFLDVQLDNANLTNYKVYNPKIDKDLQTVSCKIVL